MGLLPTFWSMEKAIRLPTPRMPTFAAPRGMLAGKIPATESATLSPARAMPAQGIALTAFRKGKHAGVNIGLTRASLEDSKPLSG